VIAKRSERDPDKESDVRKLVRYVVRADGDVDPRSWKLTAGYILDEAAPEDERGERVSAVRVTNCGTDDPAAATIAIVATQERNTRSKKDKTYHLIVSFPPGERPPLETLHAIEDELCAAIGYADHQRVSAVHIDTKCLHLHVAINKVHPTGFQNIEPYYDKDRLMEASARLEIKYGLERTNHGEKEREQRRTQVRLGPEQSPDERDTRFRRYLRESYNLPIARQPEAETLNGLRHLSGCNMDGAISRASMLLQGNARSGLEQPGEERAAGVRRAGNGLGADGGDGSIGGRAADIEASTGMESLAGYVAREVAPAMREARTWQEMHAALGAHGLEIKQRGAGLVIGDRGLALWTKASQCGAGREFAFKALTDRLGPFEEAEGAKSPRRTGGYVPRPLQKHPSTAALFAQYQRERQAATVQRRERMGRLRQEDTAYKAGLKQWSATQRALLKVGRNGPAKTVMRSVLQSQVEAGKARHRQAMAERRRAAFRETQAPSWADWLARQAERGNADALGVLRSRSEREERIGGNLLTARDAGRARDYILKSVRPVARRDGVMTYRTADGGMVVDRLGHVQAARSTTGAALVALSIAAEKFAGQALVVDGTDEFRRDVARLAGLHGIEARFSDPAMERRREEAAAERAAEDRRRRERWGDLPAADGDVATPAGAFEKPERPPVAADKPAGPEVPGGGVAPSPVTAAEKPATEKPATPAAGDAVDAWIDSRNETRARVYSLEYHRRWCKADAGAASYGGRRGMADGSEVVLLKRGDEMLVLPVTERVAAKASRWKVGQRVTVDARGRFVDRSQGAEI
jgi:hypothetical protein